LKHERPEKVFSTKTFKVQKVHIQTMLMNVCFISLFLGDLDKSATFIWIHFTMFFYEIDF